MRKIFSNVLLLSVFFCLLALPVITHAWSPSNRQIIPCGTSVNNKECDFYDLIWMAKNIMDFITYMSIPISAALFAWSGFLLVLSGDNEGNRKKAKSIFSNVAIGLCIILLAWVIVYTIAKALVDPTYYSLPGLNLQQ